MTTEVIGVTLPLVMATTVEQHWGSLLLASPWHDIFRRFLLQPSKLRVAGSIPAGRTMSKFHTPVIHNPVCLTALNSTYLCMYEFDIRDSLTSLVGIPFEIIIPSLTRYSVNLSPRGQK